MYTAILNQVLACDRVGAAMVPENQSALNYQASQAGTRCLLNDFVYYPAFRELHAPIKYWMLKSVKDTAIMKSNALKGCKFVKKPGYGKNKYFVGR